MALTRDYNHTSTMRGYKQRQKGQGSKHYHVSAQLVLLTYKVNLIHATHECLDDRSKLVDGVKVSYITLRGKHRRGKAWIDGRFVPVREFKNGVWGLDR